MLERLETHKVESFADGRYEWVVATDSYAADARDAGTARIADLALVPTAPDGTVRFRGDVVMLRPTEGGNGRALLSVPNRGVAHLPFTVGALPGGTAAPLSAGDGFLLNQGWTIAFPGWQWDVRPVSWVSPHPSSKSNPGGCAPTSG